MPTINISAQDRIDAENFLESFLTSALPAGDFSKGSFLRDVAITSIAYTVAYMRAESTLAAQRASVKRVLAMTPGQDRDDAADDAMSNLFLTRKAGRFSRGVLMVHVSSSDYDINVPKTARFFYDTATVFVPDYTADVLIPKESIVTVADATSAVSDRYFTLNVVATSVGSSHDVSPATWLGFDPFSPYVTKVENVSKFIGGLSVESTDDFLARAPNAIAVRDLNSVRSIQTTLLDLFANLDEVVVVGAGDPEMQRDLSDVLGSQFKIHTGGFTDVYLRGPVLTNQMYEATVGAAFTDPRPELTSFTCSDVLSLGGFVTAGVQQGHVIQVYNQLSGEPSQFIVVDVKPDYVSVSSRSPFPKTRTGVDFSIGTTAPSFDQVVSRRQTGEYAHTIQVSGQVLLPQVPVYRISRVSYLPIGGSSRTTLTRANASGSVASGTYQVVYSNPSLAHTAYQVGAIKVNSSDVADGSSIRVEYDTIADFPLVHGYMADSFNRISCASVVAKGLHPVYVSLALNYTLKPNATGTVDESKAIASLVSYINSFSPNDDVNASDIITFVQGGNPAIGSILPFNINYVLYAPDGRVIPYVSNNAVKVDPALEANTPALLPNPLLYGISQRTTRVLTDASLITLTQV